MKSRRFYLYVRPVRPRPWWPREHGRIIWMGVLAGGCGWVRGRGDLFTAKQARVARAIVRDGFSGALRFKWGAA